MNQAQFLTSVLDIEYLFRSLDGETCYATVAIHDHHETWPIRSKWFRRWLVGKFYAIEGKPPASQAMADALGAIEARAQYGGNVHPVHVRVAGDDTAVYLDLVNDDWQAVRVTAAGWTVVADPPVKFRRARGMMPLPTPTKGGAVTQLRPFINVASDEQWALLIAWIIAALRAFGPYPVLALLGEQGTAKTTTQEVIRALIDPNVAPLRAEPRDARDVMIAASNGWCIGFDNISDIESWLSDCFCRLATGGGFSTRELYSDGDEIIFVAQRPVMLNGIDAVISRADLLDRALIIDLPRIPDQKRRQRREFWSAFEAARPAILGVLLDAVAVALKRQPDISLDTLPRMADFAAWSVAAEPGLGLAEGAFLRAYTNNRVATHELALEASPIAAPIRKLADQKAWKGTAAELLGELSKIADEATKKARTWPSTARGLGSALRRAAPNLRTVGVVVEFTDEKELGPRRRQIAVRSVPIVPERSDAASGSDLDRSGNDRNGSGDDMETDAGTVGNGRNAESPFLSASETEEALL